MARQYNRKYALVVTSDTGTRTIEGLRIVFNITKSLFSYPNLAEIDLYNPNPDTLAALQTRYGKISFSAGYAGNIRLIFKGQVRNIFQRQEGPDRIITIMAGDGEQDWQNSTFNKTLSENVSIKQVIEELAATFQETAIGELQGLETPADKLRGQTLSGSSKDILNTLAEDYGFQWSIQDGTLVTVPNGDVLEGANSVVINNATGMINSPTVTELGVNVTTLLNPELVPNRAFTVESNFASVSLTGLQFRTVKRTTGTGTYKAFNVTFDGDTHGDNWYSIVEGRIVNA